MTWLTFWQFWQFFDKFDNFEIFWQFWQFLTILTILTIFDNFWGVFRVFENFCDLRHDTWDTDYISDNWEQQYGQLHCNLWIESDGDSIRNSCDVLKCKYSILSLECNKNDKYEVCPYPESDPDPNQPIYITDPYAHN